MKFIIGFVMVITVFAGVFAQDALNPQEFMANISAGNYSNQKYHGQGPWIIKVPFRIAVRGQDLRLVDLIHNLTYPLNLSIQSIGLPQAYI